MSLLSSEHKTMAFVYVYVCNAFSCVHMAHMDHKGAVLMVMSLHSMPPMQLLRATDMHVASELHPEPYHHDN